MTKIDEIDSLVQRNGRLALSLLRMGCQRGEPVLALIDAWLLNERRQERAKDLALLCLGAVSFASAGVLLWCALS